MNAKTEKQLDEILNAAYDAINWNEFLTIDAYSYGYIYVYPDGSISEIESTVYLGEDDAHICRWKCSRDAIQNTYIYTEGWTTEEEDEDGYATGFYIVDDTGERISEAEAVARAIRDGQWVETQDSVWKKMEEEVLEGWDSMSRERQAAILAA